jgi:hypothetical protein
LRAFLSSTIALTKIHALTIAISLGLAAAAPPSAEAFFDNPAFSDPSIWPGPSPSRW